jgi:DNA (cytosine-5)-methyltransferase 1
MIGMTLCSGIGAPEMAAPWVDWRFASEVEPFPRAVLQERFGYRPPEDHNQGDPLLWGDMTEVTPDLMRSSGVPLPDILVAGTPCQAFSVAGLRKGLSDARGNLTLKFVEICHAIVDARPDGKLAVLWENVLGVLSDKENAFGAFLGGLVGGVDALPPPGDGSWPGEGMVQGPRARAAWAVLDAQYFGVAQRRRRVFVVVDFGGVLDPAAVLLEPESLRGHPPARGKAGEDVTSRSGSGAVVSSGHGWWAESDVAATIRAQDSVTKADTLIPSTGSLAHCLNAGAMGRIDYETETMIAHALRGEGFDASEDGTGRGTPLVPVAYRTTGNDGVYETGDQVGALTTTTDPNAQIVAFLSKDYGADAMQDLSPTLRAGGHDGSHANAGVPPAIAIQERAISENPNAGRDGAGIRTDGTAYTLEARQVPQAVAFDLRGRDGGAQVESVGETVSLRAADGGSSRSYVADQWAVRRLMPVEAARLQGFPDHHTAITYRGKPAADGPQYRAYGNSMAVPVVRYIMDRMRISMEASL